jgi:hypothetical protein
MPTPLLVLVLQELLPLAPPILAPRLVLAIFTEPQLGVILVLWIALAQRGRLVTRTLGFVSFVRMAVVWPSNSIVDLSRHVVV